MSEAKKTLRNRITRMKIGEAIISLLDKTPLSDIRISAISKLSGISRMTFYHYYESKEAALLDYLTEIVYIYQQELVKNDLYDKFLTVDHLEFTFKFFARYSKLILKLEEIGCYKNLVGCLNDFFEREYISYFNNSVYNMYFYSGGIMNVFLKWLHDGKNISPRKLAREHQMLLTILRG